MKVKFTDLKSEFFYLEKDLINSFKKIGKKGDYVLGKELEIFENKIKKFLNANYVLGVGNWTEGMIMVCKALNLSKQDEIITVSNSFIATCGAISYAGCKPIMVDVDKTLNIDVELLEKKITNKTKAIIELLQSNIDAVDMPANLLAYYSYAMLQVGNKKSATKYFDLAKSKGLSEKYLTRFDMSKKVFDDFKVKMQSIGSIQ